MKPLKLTMSAFGSYADKQLIDFNKLGGFGLYLITGETGSGKTTIFDAISYALFGQASGGSRNKYQMLRSDYVEGRVKTFVNLDFAVGDSLYNIIRTITPHIARTGEVSYTDSVALTLSDKTTLDRDSEVKAKIAEIVGLDREQFSQIVMIAQNDFLRFLQSGTDKRVEILRRIFGTGALKYFQESLKTRAREVGGELDSCRHDFERREVDPYKRDEQFAEWETQIKTDKTILSNADNDLGGYEKRKTDLAAQTAVAEELSKKFSDLDAALTAMTEHSSKIDEMKFLATRRHSGEIALRRIKPLADKAAETTNQYAQILSELAKAKQGAKTAFTELEAASAAFASLPPLAEKQAAFENLRQEHEKAESLLTKLTALQTDYAAIVKTRSVLEKLQADFETLNADYIAINAAYEAMNEAFLRGQAGLLAMSLKSGEPCPVCGSTEHPAPARLTDDDITDSKLKKKKDAAEKARNNRDAKTDECSGVRAQIETLSKRFLADFLEFVPGADGKPDTVLDAAREKLLATLTATKAKTKELTSQKESGERALAELIKGRETATKRNADANAAHKAALALVGERERREQEQSRLLDEAKSAYSEALKSHNFAGESEYAAALVTEDELAVITKQLADYEKEGERRGAEIKRLRDETSDKVKPDLDKLTTEAELVNAAISELRDKRDKVKSRLEQTENLLKELRRSAERFVKLEKRYAAIKQLSDTANGRLDFETYAQTAYFERVLLAANSRLKLVSQNRYKLLRKTDSDDARRRSGLELEVIDAYTGKSRSANSLSGGESFMASLSLALGLSDVVQQSVGGIRLDAMFIDEGFGSLDAEVLELAVRTLSDMANSGRIIGIISHVSELREMIPKQICVEKTHSGSKVSLVV
ncbi:hypothetical protein AGMMS50276_10410 [Synergistales bacterium]|nr:hypothetical protein AGMMS50276_10410 [Synergistales bacterium]